MQYFLSAAEFQIFASHRKSVFCNQQMNLSAKYRDILLAQMRFI